MTGDPVDARPVYQGIRTGGRSARVRNAVLAATVEELRTSGYADLSIPRIAKAADVAVTTIYRRWPHKSQLLAEVVSTVVAAAVVEPDLGSIEEDLMELARGVTAALTEPTVLMLLRSVLSLTNDEFHDLTTRHWRERHAVAERIVQRAVQRGDIPTQPEPRRVVELVTSGIWLRAFVTHDALDEGALKGLVEDALIIARHRPVA
ncbi:MAG: TetR/AcrR family transcriptional regulator [Solirubrobacteraceae bacterium]|nr:TetR/AcrR family transcriptional regulator [Solirubrobacteraceae bacterium]